MWNYYYIIIIILVLMKLMFWMCYFLSRAQRTRTARLQRRILIVETRSVPVLSNDRVGIVEHEVLPDTRIGPLPPGGFHAQPPTYEETVHTNPSKPPSYEQAMSNDVPPPCHA